MFLYAERILVQILAFSLGPLIGLVGTAFISPYSGILIGLVSFFIIFLQPFFSDICLKNTAKALSIGDIILAEGRVTYYTRSPEMEGKLFLSKEKLVFVSSNQIDFFLPIEKITKVEGEKKVNTEETNTEIAQVFERKSANLPQFTAMVPDLLGLSFGELRVSLSQNIFSNKFSFEVSNPSLWAKTINELLKSRA